ncbi:MAG: hypothetical protein ABEI27_10730 [Halobellus sp.]
MTLIGGSAFPLPLLLEVFGRRTLSLSERSNRSATAIDVLPGLFTLLSLLLIPVFAVVLSLGARAVAQRDPDDRTGRPEPLEQIGRSGSVK